MVGVFPSCLSGNAVTPTVLSTVTTWRWNLLTLIKYETVQRSNLLRFGSSVQCDIVHFVG